MMTISHGLVECGVMSTGLSTTLADWSRRRYVSLLKSTHFQKWNAVIAVKVCIDLLKGAHEKWPAGRLKEMLRQNQVEKPT